jgi:hypothetical protein
MIIAIPWGHHVNLMAKAAQPAQRLYYLQATARFGWSRNLEFLGIRQQVKERELEDRLIDRLRDFILEPATASSANLEVEFALKSKANPIGVAEYQLQRALPAKLRGKLPTARHKGPELLSRANRHVPPDLAR